MNSAVYYGVEIKAILSLYWQKIIIFDCSIEDLINQLRLGKLVDLWRRL